METYYKLNNFPEKIIQDIKQSWIDNDWKIIIDTYKSQFFHYRLDRSKKVYEHFPECDKIEFYEQIPGVKNRPHSDRGRFAAINIPVEVDYANSFFYIGKYFDLAEYSRDFGPKVVTQGNKSNKLGQPVFYKYDEKLMEKYNLRTPVIFDTKVPHGGVNTDCPTRRIIASISYQQYTYEQVLGMISPEWF